MKTQMGMHCLAKILLVCASPGYRLEEHGGMLTCPNSQGYFIASSSFAPNPPFFLLWLHLDHHGMVSSQCLSKKKGDSMGKK